MNMSTIDSDVIYIAVSVVVTALILCALYIAYRIYKKRQRKYAEIGKKILMDESPKSVYVISDDEEYEPKPSIVREGTEMETFDEESPYDGMESKPLVGSLEDASHED